MSAYYNENDPFAAACVMRRQIPWQAIVPQLAAAFVASYMEVAA